MKALLGRRQIWLLVKPIVLLESTFIVIFYSDLILTPLTKGFQYISFNLSGDLLGFLSFLNYFFLFPLGITIGVVSVLDRDQKRWLYVRNAVAIGAGVPTIVGFTWTMLAFLRCGFFTGKVVCDMVIPLLFLIYNSFFALSTSFLTSMYLYRREGKTKILSLDRT